MQNSGFNFGTSSIQGVTSKIAGLDSVGSIGGGVAEAAPTEEQGRSFAQTLQDCLGTVNEAQDGAKKATEALMTGKAESLHEVQVAGAKAEIMMKLTTTVTSKLAQATTQLFQMQV
jgi:flagellar hook-basal body complex protein FliE